MGLEYLFSSHLGRQYCLLSCRPISWIFR